MLDLQRMLGLTAHPWTYSASTALGTFFLNPLGLLPWTAVRDCGPAQSWTYSASLDLQRILGLTAHPLPWGRFF